MREYRVEELLLGIKDHDGEVLNYIYKSFYQQIKFFVLSNSGTDDDAQDVYQEALIIIYRKLKNGDLTVLDCSFNTYLYSVCRLLWLKQLEKMKLKKGDYLREEDLIMDDQESIIQLYEQTDRLTLFQKHFQQLKKDCRRVLELSLEKIPLRKIASLMGYKSEKYAKKRKYQCKERLIENIKKDPKFKELI